MVIELNLYHMWLYVIITAVQSILKTHFMNIFLVKLNLYQNEHLCINYEAQFIFFIVSQLFS